MTRSVVITGTGAVTSLGTGAHELTERWIAGESGIADGRSACADFDPGQHMSRREIRRSDRFTQMAIVAAEEAIAEAGWNGEPLYPPERVGCIVGTGVGGIATLEQQLRNLIEKGPNGVSPMTVPMMMPNSPAGYLAMRHGWRGPSFAVSSACATGGHAIGVAMRIIQSGDADAVVTGATDAGLTELGLGAFRAMEALSPSGTSLPFDARRDGFVMGEGAGAVMLEAADAAEARGATILAEVLGYGTTEDAHHITAPDPEATGAVRAMQLALEDAGVEPDRVDYVNAHGTGTELNDQMETLAVKRTLGEERARKVPVSSTKSVIGHLMGAAGIVEAIATIHALRRKTVPPTVGWAEREDGLDLDYVPESRPLHVNGHDRSIALSNSFGFGGHNVVLCLAAHHS